MERTMEGRTVLVTGATSGIGEETARALARMGARVLITGRNRERGEAICAEIRRESGVEADLLVADFASLAAVRALAAAARARCPTLDVLVNNAGLVLTDRRETPDGHEMTFAVNHLAPFLLTHLLLPALRAAPAARVVNVSSAAHRVGKLDLDDLMARRTPYAGFRVYGTTKLCNILFTAELARRLAGTAITTNALHPGTIASGFGRDAGGFLRFLIKVGRPFIATTVTGARTSIYLASSPEVAEVTGRYFIRCKARRPSRAARDMDAARRLWEASEDLVKLAQEERLPAPPAEAAPAGESGGGS